MRQRKFAAILLAISLTLFVSGCKKKAPAPAPPPPPPPPEAPKPKPRPAVGSFTADPTTVIRGQCATLRWSVSNADKISIDPGVGSVQADGSRTVCPTSTTRYTLRASGEGGSADASATVNVTEPPKPVERPKPPPPPPPVASLSELVGQLLSDAFFDYDKSDIREDARSVLTRDAESLKDIFNKVRSGSVYIEGHCDERGSAEYNVGLGDRRATSAKEFLVQLGVPADRLQTVSYGKERPQCTESNETCWQKNRRVHFTAR